MTSTFSATIERFEKDMGWYYVSVPTNLCEPLLHLADRGLIAVTASVGESSWDTSLLPMGDGTHFLALPAKVRSKEDLSQGMEIEASFKTRVRNS
ncbi:MAG: DUF1905 domain-containing protein [Propionibacteriaceae bacterium]|nr:DUF1905 domain-containing protein [Propionibacteriaceae bacterium]